MPLTSILISGRFHHPDYSMRRKIIPRDWTDDLTFSIFIGNIRLTFFHRD